MQKRILHTLILIIVSVAVLAVHNVQTAVAHEEKMRTEAEAEAQRLSKERAQAAWNAMDESDPYLHMGVASSVDDVIFMGQLHEDGLLLEMEKEKEAPEQPSIGNIYKAQESRLVCIDAGHLGYTAEGWKNTGSESVHGIVEHTWSLEVARVVRDELISRGYDVYMVRDTDVWKEFPYDLGERQLFINEMQCDAMVAIHWDGLDLEEVDGYHTIYKGDKESDNYLLAKSVSDEYGKAVSGAISRYHTPMDRDDLWQLNWADKKMASIILECGFCTNYHDATWLENKKNFQTIAEGIANGLDKFFELKEARDAQE